MMYNFELVHKDHLKISKPCARRKPMFNSKIPIFQEKFIYA